MSIQNLYPACKRIGKKWLERVLDEIHSDKVPSSHSNEIKRFVQRLITSKETGEFFNNGEWTPDVKKAQEFPDSASAMAACVKYKLKGVELVFRFDSAGHFLSIPLADRG